MKTLNFTHISFLLLVFFLAACGGESESNTTPENSGNTTHEYIVENAVFSDLDGNEVSVKDYKGKLILIDFWESWCGPCLQVFPSMEELRGEHPDEFQVFAVTVGLNEGPEDARRFAEEHGYDFVWLYDENGVFEKLGGQGIPFKAYVDPDGKFIKVEIGSYGRQGDYNRTKEMITEYFGE